MEYHSALLTVFDVLQKHKVNYLVVGGTAVAFHGYYRKSTTPSGEKTDKPDIDIWYSPTYPNYYNLLHALEELGKDATQYKEETSPDPKRSFFKLEFDDYTLDLLPSIKAPLKFMEAFTRRVVVEANGVEISLICLEDLIQDKEVNPRPKDIDDIAHLRGE